VIDLMRIFHKTVHDRLNDICCIKELELIACSERVLIVTSL